jgi:putative heme-binding domain-containing protein
MRAIVLLSLILCPIAPCPLRAAEDVDAVVALLEFVIEVDEDAACKCLATLRKRVASGEVSGERLDLIRQQLGKKLQLILRESESPLFLDSALLATAWGDATASKIVHSIAVDQNAPVDHRIPAIESLAAARDNKLFHSAEPLLAEPATPSAVASSLLAALGKYERAEIGQLVLRCYDRLSPDLQPKAIELLTQRSSWSRQLLAAIGKRKLPATALNVNQVRKFLAGADKELAAIVRSKWGEVRTERNPAREKVIRQMRDQLGRTSGNPRRGRKVYDRVCGQCHKIYGAGQAVGPEITRNGRGTFEQLLSNVFDPSLVIGASYQARTVITADGRVLTGLLAEDNDQRIVLKTQGGKLEIIPRDEVDEIAVSKLSLMPEGLEKQLPTQDLADLFAFLALDQPPDRDGATLIPGTPKGLVGD